MQSRSLLGYKSRDCDLQRFTMSNVQLRAASPSIEGTTVFLGLTSAYGRQCKEKNITFVLVWLHVAPDCNSRSRQIRFELNAQCAPANLNFYLFITALDHQGVFVRGAVHLCSTVCVLFSHPLRS
jgi:hypothetical protein